MYHIMTANRVSTGTCGHLILPGDTIGYERDTRRTKCRVCIERELRNRHGRVLERMKVR